MSKWTGARSGRGLPVAAYVRRRCAKTAEFPSRLGFWGADFSPAPLHEKKNPKKKADTRGSTSTRHDILHKSAQDVFGAAALWTKDPSRWGYGSRKGMFQSTRLLVPKCQCHFTVPARTNLRPHPDARAPSHGDWAKSLRYRYANWTLSSISPEQVAHSRKTTPDVASRLWWSRTTSGFWTASMFVVAPP